jgi:hypothetical protein
MGWWRQRPPRRDPDPPRPIDERVLVGVPDVFSRTDTTYGMVRNTAASIRDRDWQSDTERGLAITLLAVIADLERVLYPDD